MDLSSLLASSSDDETRALNALLDAFSCAFSLEDIATAYCRANGDVNKAGDFLTDPQLSMPQGSEVDPSIETNLPQIEKAVEESYMENSSQTGTCSWIDKAVEENYMEISSQTRMHEKLPKFSASVGTVSSMLVKGSSRATAPVNRASEKEKPLKVELPEYMRDDFNVKTDESNSAPKRETLNNRGVEEFLFCMLGEGFKLSMEVIREVLGSCGYDIKKSMEELMSFSAKDPGKKADNKHNVIQDASAESSFPKGSCIESQSASSVCSLHEKKHSSRLQISPGELIESIFTVPERSEEEPKGRRYKLGANRSRVPDQKPVLKPLDDISSYLTDLPVKVILGSKEPVVDNEDDYQNYRRAAKQHWDMMKQYYEKIHTKKRNRLEHKKLNDLVYVAYNRKMTSRFQKRREEGGKSYDPLVIEEFDWGNEWVDPMAEAPQGARGCDLTWDHVDEAIGASRELQGRNLPRRAHGDPLTYTRRVRCTSRMVEEDEPHLGNEEEEEEEEIMLDDDDVDDYGEDPIDAIQHGGGNNNDATTNLDEFELDDF